MTRNQKVVSLNPGAGYWMGIFSHLFVVRIVMFLFVRDKNKRKEAWVDPFKKRISHWIVRCETVSQAAKEGNLRSLQFDIAKNGLHNFRKPLTLNQALSLSSFLSITLISLFLS